LARDEEVERILNEAGVALLRIENRAIFDKHDLLTSIKEKLGNPPISEYSTLKGS
jgi:very-short-patch-repair endonuclease